MNNFVIQVDSRENRNEHVLEQFNNMGYKYIVSKLYVGDYTLLQKSDVIIDRKNSLMEVANNICNSREHERFKRELTNAKENNIKLYILIEDEFIFNLDGVKYYQVPRYKSNGKKNGVFHRKGEKMTQVNFEALGKAMKTMEERYGCTFAFAKHDEFGKKVVEILTRKKEV